MHAVELTSGHSMPLMGLGTWDLKGPHCTEVVGLALDLGYRQIDTAHMYQNQEAIGKALAQSGVDRREIFLTTKIWKDALRHEQVLRQFQECLELLGTPYVDLLLIHWPDAEVPLEETLGSFNALCDQGKVRSIGVSNFSSAQVDQAQAVSRAPVCVNQVLYHVGHNQEELRRHHQDQKVVTTAYCPLARGKTATDQMLRQIGQRHGKSAAQVALRWLVQKAVVVIPKASSKEHLSANQEIFDWELTSQEMAQLDRT